MPSASDPSDRLQTLAPSLRALAERGVAKSFRKGQRLIDEGDSGDTLYIITKGRLRVFGSSDNGREITYGTYDRASDNQALAQISKSIHPELKSVKKPREATALFAAGGGLLLVLGSVLSLAWLGRVI